MTTPTTPTATARRDDLATARRDDLAKAISLPSALTGDNSALLLGARARAAALPPSVDQMAEHNRLLQEEMQRMTRADPIPPEQQDFARRWQAAAGYPQRRASEYTGLPPAPDLDAP